MKKIQEFLSDLAAKDIKLWVDGERLRCNAPKEILTSEIRAQLTERKAEIINFLQELNSNSELISPVRRNGQSLPLSWGQERLWFLNQLEGGSNTYNMPGAICITGELNITILEATFAEIVRRHEILRTNFKLVDNHPVQVINPEVTFKISVVDLQPLSSLEQELQVKQLAQQEAQTNFNLEQDILLRVKLLQLSPSESVMLLTMHHIVSDGWSIGVLIQELSILYTALAQGKSNPLPELPIQYADFAVWQKQWLSGERLETQLNYWQQQLAGAPELLELPSDRPRPPVQSYAGSSCSFKLTPELTQKLNQLSQQCGVTLYMTLLAAFGILMHRYSRQEEVVIGSPIANRNRSEIESLIGFFVNTLVLRINLEDQPSFTQLVEQVRQLALDAYAHQDVPFEKVVEKLQPERNLSYHPLFQVMFVLQNTPDYNSHLSALTVKPKTVETVAAKFDLTLSMTETEAGLEGILEYKTDLFDGTTIERMVGHWETLLTALATQPETKVTNLPLLTPAERHQLLVEWNQTQVDYPQDRCIHQLFEEQVEKTPLSVAVVFDTEQLTYHQLNQRANQLAHYLQSLGLGPEVLVGICTERSVEMVVGLLGILKAGGAYVPLDPNYPQERLSYMLADSGVKVLLTQQSLLESLPQNQAQVVCLDRDWEIIERKSGDNLDAGVSSDNLAYVIYTSGSTGKPKGVLIEHQGLCNLAQAQRNSFNVEPTSHVLQFASVSFDASVSEIFMALTSGSMLVLGTASQLMPGDDLKQILADYSITHVTLPPSALAVLPTDELPALGQIIVAGEACSLELVHQWSVGRRFFNAYGPTESTVCATIAQISDGSEKITIGRPIANVQIYILDSQLQPLPIGVSGELYIGGDGLARGYLNRPELTATKFISNPFHERPESRIYKTGDLARYLPDGNLEFLGRIDHQVKIRGFRIELGEIEALLASHADIGQTIAIVREDRPGDKRIVAYVVPKPERAIDVKLIRQYLQEHLPDYMIPAAFVTLESFPLTNNGKINRGALPKPELTNFIDNKQYVAPRTDTERELATIWSKTLTLEQVGIHDNFFEIGGHSLLALRLFAAIQAKFHLDLSINTLFKAPTIAELAAVIDKQDVTPTNSHIIAIQPDGDKEPFFFVHGGAGGLMKFQKLAKYIGADRPFYGIEAIGMDGKEEIPATVEATAARYVEELRALKPNGPYLLGGLCFGGKIAYEMAQQLHAQGQEVAKLILFNTAATGAFKRSPLIQRLESHLVNSLEKGPSFAIQKIQGKIAWIKHKKRKNLKNKQIKAAIKASQAQGRELSYQERHLPVAEAHIKADKMYFAKPYPGKVILLQTERDLKPPEGYTLDSKWGWGEVAQGGLEIHVVPGGHNAVLTDENIPIQAKVLKDCLDRS